MQSEIETLLPAVVALCYEAGTSILRIYNDHQKMDIAYKKDNSPLTQADLQSDQILKSGLAKIANFPYLSEESAQVPYAERAKWETYWLVDPLDGTKEFINKTNEFTINVALVHKAELVLGVVYAPALNTTYFGSRTTGAFRKEKNAIAIKLPIEDNHNLELKIVVSRSHASSDELSILQPWIANKQVTTISIGSSLKFCLLAEGSADLYPRSGPTCEWDTGAGQAILMFSNGAVYDYMTKESLRYNKEKLLNGKFVAVSHKMLVDSKNRFF